MVITRKHGGQRPEKNLLHFASINPSEMYPNYSTVKINNSILNNKSELDLICSKDSINSIEPYLKIPPVSQKGKCDSRIF